MRRSGHERRKLRMASVNAHTSRGYSQHIHQTTKSVVYNMPTEWLAKVNGDVRSVAHTQFVNQLHRIYTVSLAPI